MKILPVILIAALAAQLATAGAMYYQHQSRKAVIPAGAIVHAEIDTIDHIAIATAAANVELKRKDSSWQIVEGELPVDNERLNAMLESLVDLKTGWPVTTSTSSHEQLEVADDSFQKHVTVAAAGEVVGDFYIGSSPGFRRAHVRTLNSDDVYAVAINSYDLPEQRSDWLDKNALMPGDIDSITDSAGLVLRKHGDTWKLGDNDVDQTKADALVTSLQQLRVLDIADELPGDAESLTLQVQSGGEMQRYVFSKKDEQYLVKKEGLEVPFSVSKASYNSITDSTLDQLIVEPTTPSVADEEQSAPEPEQTGDTTTE